MDREYYVRHAQAYLVIGDLDKPFHYPECECVDCEHWRRCQNRPTHAELRTEPSATALRK